MKRIDFTIRKKLRLFVKEEILTRLDCFLRPPTRLAAITSQGHDQLPMRCAFPLLIVLIVAAGCPAGEIPELPAPDAWGPTTGPGLPTTAFDEADLWTPCAYLDGGPEDGDHHNLVAMYDGYLLMPWAPEWSHGGISFFDMSEPCAPTKVGEAFTEVMRESHSLSFSNIGGRYLAVDTHHAPTEGGVGFWDIADPTNPVWVGDVTVFGYGYPDSYARVTIHTFWQGPWLYVAGADTGVYVLDARDPRDVVFHTAFNLDPPMRVGSFHVVGNRALMSTLEGARTALIDLSDPVAPKLIAGGDFNVTDATGEERDYYFANVGGQYALFARKEGAGGPILYDLTDPEGAQFVGDHPTVGGNGGYVSLQGDDVFVGDSHWGAVLDFSDPSAATETGRASIPGDLDTATPVGHFMVLSVDDESISGQASAVVPWRTDADVRGPRIGFTSPADGELFVPVTGRVGISFDEPVEPVSVFAGSFRVTAPSGELVPGWFNAQENIANFTPEQPLTEDTVYTVEIPAGGIVDPSGNTADPYTFRFSTGASLDAE